MGRPGRPPKPKLSPVDTTSSRLSKAQVLENWDRGLYKISPELWIPHALGEALDPWQDRVVRALFLGEKHKVTVRAGHGSGKCVHHEDKLMLANGSLVRAGELIHTTFPVLSVDKDLHISTQYAYATENGMQPVWKLTTESGRSIRRTANHPILIYSRNDQWEWCPISRISHQWGVCMYEYATPPTDNDYEMWPTWPTLFLPHSFHWEEITALEYIGIHPTVAIHVPGNETFLTDFVEHNTYLSSRLTLQFLMNYIPSIAVATGPTGKQTASQFWSQLSIAVNESVFRDDIEVLKTRLFVKGERSEDEWKALWVPCKEPRTLEGFHGPVGGKNLLWVVEEAKVVPDPVFESLSGALSNENCFLYVSSTCGPPRGHFFDSHTRLRHLYDTEHIPSTESRHVSPEKIRLWREQWGEDSPVYRARVLAEFPEEDESSIASLSWLTRAIENQDDDLEAA